ncbi:unnamed protein product [Nippostrongylus brasiliensis]|uniref:Synergin gamma n=1 Tax=Nippostrongylus brasiliensis TaxID=27835 RepID=A0A0N4YH59_NIPBR|nr:unnamed protein product [Nippostrongylus brasiliensis]
MSSLPIPFLQSVQVPAGQQLSAPVVNVAKPTAPVQKEQRQSSSFIPTSLLLGRRSNAKKKEVDLIGDALPTGSKSSDQDLPSPIPAPPSSCEFYSSDFLKDNAYLLKFSVVQTLALSSSALNDLCGIDWPTATPTAPAQSSAAAESNSFTAHSSRMSTASYFSLNNYSTASPLNHAQEIAPKIATELLDCWEKVIKAAVDIFKGADKLLCSAGDSVIEEIAQTERGDGYLRCLNHLYFVVCRVQRSAKSELPPNCQEDIALCEKVWKRLSVFIVDPEEEDRPCAICCQPVTKAVYFGGQTYHTECANLWVNDVNSLLPNMHLSS